MGDLRAGMRLGVIPRDADCTFFSDAQGLGVHAWLAPPLPPLSGPLVDERLEARERAWLTGVADPGVVGRDGVRPARGEEGRARSRVPPRVGVSVRVGVGARAGVQAWVGVGARVGVRGRGCTTG